MTAEPRRSAPKGKAIDWSTRFTLADCRAEGRCQCQGCRACRGAQGFPCAALLTNGGTTCRHCEGG